MSFSYYSKILKQGRNWFCPTGHYTHLKDLCISWPQLHLPVLSWIHSSQTFITPETLSTLTESLFKVPNNLCVQTQCHFPILYYPASHTLWHSRSHAPLPNVPSFKSPDSPGFSLHSLDTFPLFFPAPSRPLPYLYMQTRCSLSALQPWKLIWSQRLEYYMLMPLSSLPECSLLRSCSWSMVDVFNAPVSARVLCLRPCSAPLNKQHTWFCLLSHPPPIHQ